MPEYLEISVRCRPSDEELVTSFITESLSRDLVTEVNDEALFVKFYLPAVDESREKVESLGKFLVRAGVKRVDDLGDDISVRPIEDVDWVKSYQQSFKAVTIDDIVVKSTWDRQQYADKIEIIIEPKMAFGTGHHETTQLCMSQIKADLKKGDKVLDLGCGSGILCILAAKLGASECLGLDIDLAAIENAQENISNNHVENVVSIQFGSMDKAQRFGYYDLVVSNLVKDEIYNLYENFVRALKPSGILILSGILTEQEEEFQNFLKLKNPQGYLVTRMNEWICCRVVKA